MPYNTRLQLGQTHIANHKKTAEKHLRIQTRKSKDEFASTTTVNKNFNIRIPATKFVIPIAINKKKIA
jgi:hypothetical protein